MFCRKCGAKLSDTARFCPKCGTAVEPKKAVENSVASNDTETMEKPHGDTTELQQAKRSTGVPPQVAATDYTESIKSTEAKNILLQRILSLICGFVMLCGMRAVAGIASASMGSVYAISTTVLCGFLNLVAILFLLIGIIFAFVQNRQTNEKKTKSNVIALVLFSVMQMIVIFAMLFGGASIPKLFVENQNIIAISIPLLHYAAVSMLVFSIVTVMAALLVKIKSFLFILITDIVAALIGYILIYGLRPHWGMVTIGIGMGFVQPIVTLLPNIGGWSNLPKKNAMSNTGVSTANNALPYMFCPKCGIQYAPGKKFCDQCGTELNTIIQPNAASQPFPSANPADARSGGYAVLCFLFPVIGLILYLVWKDQYPLRAKSCGKGAIIGVIIWPILYVLLYFIVYSIIWGMLM